MSAMFVMGSLTVVVTGGWAWRAWRKKKQAVQPVNPLQDLRFPTLDGIPADRPKEKR